MLRRNALCLLALVTLLPAASSAWASGGSGLSWNFQRTGFASQYPGTAVAMRDGLNWPVVFMSENETVNAISLYPVKNQATNTYWHQIGDRLLPAIGGPAPHIRTASSPTSQFAVATTPYPLAGYAVTGSSRARWGTLPGVVLSVDYDSDGNLVTLTPSTVPGIVGTPRDIDSAIPGSVGVIASDGYMTTYYETSPLLGGWANTILDSGGMILGETLDLAIDANGCPHVAAVTTAYELLVFDFNTISGLWNVNRLDYLSNGDSLPTLATDSQGRVGAAWIDNLGRLKYAAKKGIGSWASGVVAASVIDPILGGDPVPLFSGQSVGLAYDANDFPVISFMTNDNKVWLAYDPPAAAPEPSSLLLIAVGLVAFVGLRRRSIY